MALEKQFIEFDCIPEKCTFNSDDFRVYGVSIDTLKFPNIQLNKYYNVTINGNIHELGLGIPYRVKAVEEQTKYGIGYKVINIKRERPNNEQSTKQFLYEILTAHQANVLLSVYPDIVDRVIHDRLDDIDLSKTNGIKEYTFNLIKRKIVENFCLVELVDEFQGMVSLSILKKLYEKYSSVKRIRQEIREEPYKCLCGLYGIGFKTADSLLLEIDKISQTNIQNGERPIIDFGYELRPSIQRQKACIYYLLQENEGNGNTKMDIRELKNQCEKLAPACTHHFTDVIKHDEDFCYDKKTFNVALTKTFETEKFIAESILKGLENHRVWDIDTSNFKKDSEFELTDEQGQALDYLCKYNFFVLNGNAGVGKTMSTQSIIKMLNASRKTYRLFAPTGRAAKVLSGYTNTDASTIHRGLGHRPPNTWLYNEKDKLTCDVVIIDEFSMVDVFLMEKVLKAIDFQRTKLMLIGDDAQIPSVGAGNILHDLIKSKKVPVNTLNKVFRYGKGGLMTVATKTRKCENFITSESQMQTFGEDKSYMFIPLSQDKIISNVKKLYEKLLTQNYEPKDIMILSCYNKGDYGTVKINQAIQLIANKNIRGDKFTFGETNYFIDDLVIQIVNNYESTIYDPNASKRDEPETTFVPNGEIGKVVIIKPESIVVDFDGVQILYRRDEMGQLKLAYSISVHKSQGGQCKVVILLTPKAHSYMLNSNLMYVGQTRAREKCYHFGEAKTVMNSIKKKENFDRQTYLKELLTGGLTNAT